MKLAAILIAPFVVACVAGSGNDSQQPTASQRDAARALSITSDLLDSLDFEARGVRPITSGTVTFTEACASSGSFSVDGSFEASDDGLVHSAAVSVGFDACAIGPDSLDGSVQWTEISEGDSYTTTLTGTITWTGLDATASCTFDVHVTVDATGSSYSGTACGYAVSDLGLDE